MADEFHSAGSQQPSTPLEGESAQGEARERGSQGATQAVKEQAGAVWDGARENVRSALAEQQQAAAAGVGDLAGALRSAAHELDSERKASVARVVGRAADGLERLAATLRSKDLDTMVSDAQTFARREPALFLGAAVAAGFLAVRFLKSGSEQHAAGAASAPATSPDGGHLH
jgi:hypothetical protein